MKKLLYLTIIMVWLLMTAQTFAVDITLGMDIAKDPYFEMNPSNLNTMNSYIIPTQTKLENVESYPTVKYSLQRNPDSMFWFTFVKDIAPWYSSLHIMSSYFGFGVVLLLLLLIWYFGVKSPYSSFGQVLRLLFDGVWDTFDWILWIKASYSIKMYVVGLFFIVLISNLLWLTNDILRFAFPQMLRFISAPTGEFETTLALAIIATAIPLVIQFKSLGIGWFIHEYVPITGKWLMEGKWIGTKIWDIVISLFVWLLDIIGIISKIISLSMRLFGNMSSGSILLNVAFLWLWWLFVSLVSVNFVVGIPIILYVQWLLVAVVQAFVFAMLTAIGIKLALE